MMALLGLVAHPSFTNASITTRQLRGCAKQNTLFSTSANLLCLCARQVASFSTVAGGEEMLVAENMFRSMNSMTVIAGMY
jgi:hypothetical protein